MIVALPLPWEKRHVLAFRNDARLSDVRWTTGNAIAFHGEVLEWFVMIGMTIPKIHRLRYSPDVYIDKVELSKYVIVFDNEHDAFEFKMRWF